MTTVVLALKELSCGHCVKNVKQALEAVPNVENAEVTLKFAKINGEADISVFIQIFKVRAFVVKSLFF